MQMVGRGLRGMKNGGTATCHVVTMLDNIIEYSDRLAYHTYFTPYFPLTWWCGGVVMVAAAGTLP